jgi:FkbM family methyltransferase
MNKSFKRFLQRNISSKLFQPFFEKLHLLSLAGMNYGNGDFLNSGELNTLKYIKKKLNGSGSLKLFDVGANIGNYSIELANCFADAQIHSFEPSQKTFEHLVRTTSGISSIKPNNIGFGDSETTLRLFSEREGSRLASVYHRNMDHLGISLSNIEEIKLSTIDNYCAANNIGRINLLKLDVEGNELNALKGAQNMLDQGNIDFIQFEMGGANIDSRTYFQDFYYLLKDKFRIYRILSDGLVEIKGYKETYEIFITINYLAERR